MGKRGSKQLQKKEKFFFSKFLSPVPKFDSFLSLYSAPQLRPTDRKA